MKNTQYLLLPLSLIVFFFVGLYFYLRFAGPIPFSFTSTVINQEDAFTVTGEGEVVAQPDIAFVVVAVEKNGDSPQEAQSQINQVISQISQRLSALGIDVDEDVKTSSYNIFPNYDWSESTRRILNYQASSSLSIKVRDINQINEVIDQSTAGGANKISSISFDVEDKEALLDEARQIAVEQAKRKAQQAAKNAGFRLGKIVNYSESSPGDYFLPIYGREMSLKDSVVPTDIQTGSTEIKINVSLSFQIE